MITAILKINNGLFIAKYKLPKLVREINVPIMLPIKNFFSEDPLKVSPIFKFIWGSQTGRYTHEYFLEEVI